MSEAKASTESFKSLSVQPDQAVASTAGEPKSHVQIAQHEVPHSSFTRHQKWLLVFLASAASTVSGFASNIYFPALPSLAANFGVSITLINLTVTSYMILQGLSPPIWGAIADSSGRRIAYVSTYVVFLAACLGLANAQNYATLVVLRCLQSAGSAVTIALGAGISTLR